MVRMPGRIDSGGPHLNRSRTDRRRRFSGVRTLAAVTRRFDPGLPAAAWVLESGGLANNA
jgi:hypothetical protein